jgi:outer membrane receptor protein involved in Fe transport
VSAQWQPCDWFEAIGSYAFLKFNEHDPREADIRQAPENAVKLQTRSRLADTLDLHVNGYYSDVIEYRDAFTAPLNPVFTADSYIRLDVGLSFRPRENVTLSAWGMNLLDPQHLESAEVGSLSAPAEVPRSFYFQVEVEF